MNVSDSPQEFPPSHPFVTITSPWMTLIGEHLDDGQGGWLDYWRVEKADSVVIVAIQAGMFLLPPPHYRPGVQQTTLDFPGGRVEPNRHPIDCVPAILERELGIPPAGITQIQLLNEQGWAINSSFSNQKLYGCVAQIDERINLEGDRLDRTYPTTSSGIRHLLQDLSCLQCRAVLQEWRDNNGAIASSFNLEI